jgi:hypothetical protein
MESFMEAAKAQNWAVEPQGKKINILFSYHSKLKECPIILPKFNTSSHSVTLKVDRFIPYQQLAHIQRDVWTQRNGLGYPYYFLHRVLLLN